MIKEQSNFNGLKNVTTKRGEAGQNINVYLSQDEIEKLRIETEQEEIPRNAYVRLALQHYWECKKA